MVSEEEGDLGFQNWAAWDWISVAATKSADGVFNTANTYRRHMLSSSAAHGVAGRAEAGTQGHRSQWELGEQQQALGL